MAALGLELGGEVERNLLPASDAASMDPRRAARRRPAATQARRARLARPGHRNARPTIRPRQGGCGKYPPSLPRVTLMHCPP